MKLRKLTGILLSAAVAASYCSMTSVTASAWGEVENWYGASSAEDEEVIDTVYSIDSYFSEGSFRKWILAELGDRHYGNLQKTITATGVNNVYLSYSNINTILSYSQNVNISLTFKMSYKGIPYSLTITTDDIVNSNLGTMSDVKSDGYVNLSLAFSPNSTKKRLYVSAKNITNGYNKANISFKYKIAYGYFNDLLSDSSLNNAYTTELAMYSLKDVILRNDIKSNADFDFEINDNCRTGFYLTNVDQNTTYYAKADSDDLKTIKSLAEDYLEKYIGVDEDDVKDYSYIESFISGAIDSIIDELPAFSTKAEIKEAVNYYLLENKSELMDAVVKSIDFDLEEEILEILGENSSDIDTETLEAYIEELISDKFEDYGLTASNILDALRGNPTVYKDLVRDIVSMIADDDVLLNALKGADGKSAYQVALDNGFVGSVTDWLNSLRGQPGADGAPGKDGETGATGAQGDKGDKGDKGDDGLNGKSAYEIAVDNGFKGTVSEWLESLSFEGWAIREYGSVDNFIKEMKGEDGLSAYEIACDLGYRGTIFQWYEDLQGKDGLSAYELAQTRGFKGTLDEWLASLKGEDGKDGEDGEDGVDGSDGRDGRDGQDAQIVYVNGTYGQVADTTPSVSGDDIIIDVSGGKPSAGNVNPATGVAAGIILPTAAIGSVLLVKKNKRRRGRK